MYVIYTTMYGICIPENLNKQLQLNEISERFDEINLPDGFQCNVPYSGDGFADIHLGIEIDSTENLSKKVYTSVTDEQKDLFKAGVRVLKKKFVEAYKEIKVEFPDCMGKEDDEIVQKFLKLLDGEPELYRAYSTS